MQFAVGGTDIVGDPGAALVGARTGAGQHYLVKAAVDTDLAAGCLYEALQRLAQRLVQAEVPGSQHHARVGAPPENRLVVAIPGEDAMGVGLLQRIGIEHAAGSEQAGKRGVVVQRLRGRREGLVRV